MQTKKPRKKRKKRGNSPILFLSSDSNAITITECYELEVKIIGESEVCISNMLLLATPSCNHGPATRIRISG